MDQRAALSTARILVCLRGLRGGLGQEWLGQCLLGPTAKALLVSTAPGASHTLMQHLLAAFHEDTNRRARAANLPSGEAGKFAQHRTGRHGGQSGGWWLEAAATPEAAVRLDMAVNLILAAIPEFKLTPPPASLQD